MKLINCIIPFFIICYGYSSSVKTQEDLNRNQISTPNSSKTITTYDSATGDENVSNWNQQDWKNNMTENGALGTGLIGTTQSNTAITGSDIATTGDPNMISTSNLRSNESLKNVGSLHSFSEQLQNDVVSSNLSRNKSDLNYTETTKCYIAREMPIRFKCEKTGLIYGAGMNSNGKDAKVNCESECYEQMTCVDVNNGGTTMSITIPNLELVEGDTKKENTTAVDNQLSFLEFGATVTQGNVYLDIEIETVDGKTQFFAQKMKLTTKDYNLKIGFYVKNIKFSLYSDSKKNSIGSIANATSSNKVSKYICPSQQDISAEKPGDFAFLCPSGRVATVSGNGQTFKMCEDYGVVGDNPDGTFSNYNTCNSICRTNFECKLNTDSISTNSLQNFREGCMEGQTNCNLDTCKALRVAKSQIINENVFDGTLTSTPTIISGSLVDGATRPKIVLTEDIDFQTRNKEEWKDKAYSNMVNKSTYRFAAKKINEDTENSDAYVMKLTTNSTDTTVKGNAIRGLYWINKPKAFDVGEGVAFKHFAVLEAVVDSLKYDLNGELYRSKDKILYVKTSESDTFKPFATKREFARKTSDKVSDTEILTSTWKYEYFNSGLGNWYALSPSTSLEYFKNSQIVLDGPYVRTPIVENYNKMAYLLPGLIRKIVKNGPYETKVYTGDFDGTGQVITNLKLYVKYTNDTSMTYAGVVEEIESGDWEQIYDSFSSSNTSMAVVSDTLNVADAVTYNRTDSRYSNEDIEIYLYGKENNKTAFTRIKPKKDDIGKKGFVYIFAQ